jgi:hypothetical protein
MESSAAAAASITATVEISELRRIVGLEGRKVLDISNPLREFSELQVTPGVASAPTTTRLVDHIAGKDSPGCARSVMPRRCDFRLTRHGASEMAAIGRLVRGMAA